MKIPSRSLLIGLVGLALAGYLLYRLFRSPAADPADIASRAAQSTSGGTAPAEGSQARQKDILAIKGELARLQYELVLLRQDVSAMEAKKNAKEGGSGAAAVKNAVAGITDSTQAEESERAHREEMEAFESSFRSEPEDPKWSEATTSTVQSVLNKDEVLRAAMRSVECRSNTCRIEMADVGSGKLNASVIAMAGQLSQILPSLMGSRIDEGYGSATVVYYLSRGPRAQGR